MSIITIVGAGMMGSAMCFPASDNGHQIRLVGTPYDREVIQRIQQDNFHPRLGMPLPPNVTAWQYEDMDEALKDCNLLIAGVASFGVDWFAENVLSRIPDDLKVLSITKGLEDEPDGSLVPISVAYNRYKLAPGRKLSICSIGGPCISMELCKRLHTSVALCGDDSDVLHWIKSQLITTYYHIQPTRDVVGIECAVAMKNAYAVGVSLAIGLAQRNGEELSNPQAALFGQSVREMLRLVHLFGGQTESVIYATSDLYVTINSGRNRKLGEALGQGMTLQQVLDKYPGMTLESIPIITKAARALRKRHELGTANFNKFPLLRHLDEIINQGAEVRIPWNEFG
ncbi:MAG: glycerol-3-phosphate dehydrogenase [Lentisphaeria bacterium]|nr:glycerol-3-phosphate dehydrogenase [Lentisphaeria bacterium]